MSALLLHRQAAKACLGTVRALRSNHELVPIVLPADISPLAHKKLNSSSDTTIGYADRASVAPKSQETPACLGLKKYSEETFLRRV